ncbi:MAG: hypothetical protein LBB34_01840 [Holosporales bacterium]|jgi:trigger factor|nr:hypothetical protein [Holosporales bacterium]
MKFENTKLDGMRREYRVILSGEEIENEIIIAVKARAKNFRMQGFRPGHVPLEIVRKNTEDTVVKEVFDTMISAACDQLVKKNNLGNLATKPTYRFENTYKKGGDVNLLFNIEIAPSFDIQPYEIEITKIVPKVGDKEVADAVKRLVEESPIHEKADKNHKIQLRDKVFYKAACFNKGVESRKKSFSSEILIPATVPEDAEFLKSFIGKKIGESFNFVPATNENLSYRITITSIEKALNVTPEIYAKKRGLENSKALSAAVREKLEQDINFSAFLYHKNQILEALGKLYSFELPQSVVEQEQRNVIATAKKELERKVGGESKGGKRSKKEKPVVDEKFEKECLDIAKKRVLLGYVLNKIALKEKITVSEKELQNVIAAEINRNQQIAKALIDRYSNDREAVSYKKAEIIEHKVISFLISKARVTQVEKTKKEVDAIVKKLLDD